MIDPRFANRWRIAPRPNIEIYKHIKIKHEDKRIRRIKKHGERKREREKNDKD